MVLFSCAHCPPTVFAENKIGHVSTHGAVIKARLEKVFLEVVKLREKRGLSTPEMPHATAEIGSAMTTQSPFESHLEDEALQQSEVSLKGWDQAALQKNGVLLLRQVLSGETIHSIRRHLRYAQENKNTSGTARGLKGGGGVGAAPP